LILIGAIFAILIGAGLPALMIFMGKLTDTFINYEFFNALAHFPNASLINESINWTQVNSSELLEILEEGFRAKDPRINLTVTRIRLKMDVDTFAKKLSVTIFKNDTEYKDVFIDESNMWSIYMAIVGIAFLICGYIMVATLSRAANNQAHRIRILFFKSILKQDISWYDTKTSGDFATKVTAYDIHIKLD
jgi:ABC-type multidrug transport system fused ATPase/permease subunit